MTATEIVPGVHQLSYGQINAFLVDDGDAGPTLIDSGLTKHVEKIRDDIRSSIGRGVSDLTNILITHAHPDHLGSAKHLSRGTTPIGIHSADGGIARAGIIEQTMSPGPGLLTPILFRLLIGNKPAEFPAFDPAIDLEDGDVLDVAGGIEVIHTPGHTAGHVSLLWKRDRGLLFTGDAAANLMGLGYSLGYDDLAAGKASLARLAKLEFEVVVFGHGKPIISGASDRFAARFG